MKATRHIAAVPTPMTTPSPATISALSPTHHGRAALTCFLVEDSPVIRENLISTLDEILGVQVLGCSEDEAGALRWLQESSPGCDLMIIDIFLKAGTGLEVLERARALRPELKLVVLTNYATTEMRQRCIKLGADRVFDKSAELEELLAYCRSVQATR